MDCINSIRRKRKSVLPSRQTTRPRIDRRRVFRVGVRRLLEHSTVHGLCHVSTATTRLGRTAWFCLWLAGIAGFVINLSLVVDRYLTRPVLTSYVGDYEGFIWPDITVCNPMAPYMLHTPERAKRWAELRKWATQIAGNVSGKVFADIEEMDQNEIAIQALMHSTLSPTTFGVGQAEDMVQFVATDTGTRGAILTVELDGNLSPVEHPLGDYFHTQVLQKRYNVPCYTLQLSDQMNYNQTRRVEKIGIGLKFNFKSYLIVNSSYTSPTMDLFFSLPGEVPHVDPIELLPGYMHTMALTMSRFRREPARQPCRHKPYYAHVYDANLITKRRVQGSASFCHRIVSQKLYIRHCACYSPFLPYPVHPDGRDEAPVLCFNMSRFSPNELDWNARCMHRIYNLYRERSTYIRLTDAQVCETFRETPPCEQIDYKLDENRRTAMVELWSESFNEARASFLVESFRHVFREEAMPDPISMNNSQLLPAVLSHMRKNFALLTIRRKVELGELVREELEYPLPELLSDVGGLMGLWIGISVIGMFEVIELCGFALYTISAWLTDRRQGIKHPRSSGLQFECNNKNSNQLSMEPESRDQSPNEERLDVISAKETWLPRCSRRRAEKHSARLWDDDGDVNIIDNHVDPPHPNSHSSFIHDKSSETRRSHSLDR